jgi:HK97 family phage prohead protease
LNAHTTTIRGGRFLLAERIDLTAVERQIREEELQAVSDFIEGKAEAPQMYASGHVVRAEGDGEGKPVGFVASHESPDRAGDQITAAGWNLANFEKNPVVPWAHRYDLQPVGRALDTRISAKSLLTKVQFDSGNQFAADVERQVRGGFINAVSVGFRPIEAAMSDREGRFGMNGVDFMKSELLEISIVPVPMHARALRRALEDYESQFYIQMPGLDLARDLHKGIDALVVPQPELTEQTAPEIITLDPTDDLPELAQPTAEDDTEQEVAPEADPTLSDSDISETVRQIAGAEHKADQLSEEDDPEENDEDDAQRESRDEAVTRLLESIRTVTAPPSEEN